MHGAYDFNATPVASPGTRVVVHENPAFCGSWAIQGVDGWCMGHALHHYRCFEVFVNKTAHSHKVDAVEFFPHHFAMPFPSSTYNAIEAAK